MNRRAAWVALIVSTLCAIGLLVYGVQRFGPFADQAVLVALFIGLFDSLALSVWRQRTQKDPRAEGVRTGNLVLPLNRAALIYIYALALLGLVLVALGFILPGPASLVWILSGAVMLFLVVAIIVRFRQQS